MSGENLVSAGTPSAAALATTSSRAVLATTTSTAARGRTPRSSSLRQDNPPVQRAWPSPRVSLGGFFLPLCARVRGREDPGPGHSLSWMRVSETLLLGRWVNEGSLKVRVVF
jgi:hypothetical protein